MAKKTKAQLEAQVADLEAQLVTVKQKFEKYVLGGVKLTRAGPSDDGKGFELQLSDARGIVQLMADALVTVFEADGGINYVEYEMRHIERNEYFILSLQRKNGKRPGTLHREAEEKLRDLLTACHHLRAAQRTYMANRGNEEHGKAVGQAAEHLDKVMEKVSS